MCIDEEKKEEKLSRAGPPGGGAVRIDLVDNWHKAWPRVLEAIDRSSNKIPLRVDHDGWLSARQLVLAAFDGENVAGHAVFSVEPARDEARTVHRSVAARLDGVGVSVGFDERDVRQRLLEAAAEHARLLRVRDLVGFD